ncbi:DUF6382 domain-containing protein [Saccharibacillus sp. CPCC 101409]|uniref:DUF6382 domain-containing protein n=1 Tax=Saccharibacillus sp. CPCC 101409 TaxID=3058041 RepID=UPI002673ECCC|nr:DUF6382 domain-containing protein [Saccharibacillus sp. CPCC 101409]MDO3408639.1 DUF6382 domain-containing protein [Saccharibacillus sp. CPCC 101409]
MEEFETDFIQSDTTYLVLKSGQKLTADRLNRVQIKMLAASNVPHVLNLHVREVDSEAQLHYDIGGKRMLSSWLKTEKLTLVEYYALLLQIVTALEYGMTYMLNPNGFWLQEDYMFVDGPLSAGTIYLTYLPLNDAPAEPNRERIGRLASRWMTAIDDLRGSGIQRILHLCEQSSFSLQTLKSLLIGLLAESGQHGWRESGVQAEARPGGDPYSHSGERANTDQGPYGYGSPSVEAPREMYGSGPAPVEYDRGFGRPGIGAPGAADTDTEFAEDEEQDGKRKLFGISIGKSQGGNASGRSKAGKESKATFGQDRSEEQEDDTKPPQNRLVIPLVCLMLLAVLWKFLYLGAPSTFNLLICVVLTPLLGTLAYLGWTNKLKPGGRNAARREEEEEAEALSSWSSSPAAAPQGHRVSYSDQGYGMSNRQAGPGSEQMAEQPPRPRASAMGSIYGRSETGADSNGSGIGTYAGIPDFLKPGYSAALSGIEAQPAAGAYPVAAGGYAAEGVPASPVPGTGMLGPPASQPTVMLDGARGSSAQREQAGVPAVPRYRLERAESGASPRTIPLPSGSFTIGRAEDVAQHIETSAGISRAHVELELSEGRCVIRDIGSRNGTTLNEEALTPYKAYELNEGDTFRIAGISYTLRCG